MHLHYEVFVTGALAENAYLVWEDQSREGIFVDPGDEPDRLMDRAEQNGLTIIGVFNTHSHIDHIAAVEPIVSKLNVPFALHVAETDALKTLEWQASMFGLPTIVVPAVDRYLQDNDDIRLGDIRGKVIWTPGHSPGSVCFLLEGLLFSGDTLFSGSIGRSDLPGGNPQQLRSSLHEKLMVLEDAVRVLPGHGPESTIGQERMHNPFIREDAFF